MRGALTPVNTVHDPGIEERVMTYVLASLEPQQARRLATVIGDDALVEQVALDPAMLAARVAMLGPVAVFVDFSGASLQPAAAAVLAVRQAHPGLPVLGLGLASEPAGTLAALRAGVDDFIDVAATPQETAQVMRTLAARRAPAPGLRGQLAVLLGGRPGLGVSTLAVNLAVLLHQSRSLPLPAERREVALLDLGLPVGDGLLYLDAPGDFSFVEAVRNLRRFDQTLVQTALIRQRQGVAVLPLPTDLAQLRDISHADSVALIRRLRDFFDVQVADFGGFSNQDFLAQVLRGAECDKVWVVCDQGIASMVSTAQLLSDLRERGVDTRGFGLVVNKFDPQVGLAAGDIAERLQLGLEAVLPARGTALLKAAIQGATLANLARHDPYVQAVDGLAARLLPGRRDAAAGGAAGALWARGMSWVAGKRREVSHVKRA